MLTGELKPLPVADVYPGRAVHQLCYIIKRNYMKAVITMTSQCGPLMVGWSRLELRFMQTTNELAAWSIKSFNNFNHL